MWCLLWHRIALVIQEEFVNKVASLVINLLFIFQRLRCTELSDVLFICIWHSIVRAYKSDLLTSSWGLLPKYFHTTRTLEYHIISREVKKNRFWYKSFQILNDSLVYRFFGSGSSRSFAGVFTCKLECTRIVRVSGKTLWLRGLC